MRFILYGAFGCTCLLTAALVLASVPGASPKGLDPLKGATFSGPPLTVPARDERNPSANNLARAARAVEESGGDAMSVYVSALDLHPADHALLHNFAGLRASGEPSAAVELYKRALKVEPGNIETMNCLGKLLCDLGDTAAAIAVLRRAVKAQPAHTVSRCNLAMAEQALGHWDTAEELLRDALQFEPASAAVAANLGMLLRYLLARCRWDVPPPTRAHPWPGTGRPVMTILRTGDTANGARQRPRQSAAHAMGGSRRGQLAERLRALELLPRRAEWRRAIGWSEQFPYALMVVWRRYSWGCTSSACASFPAAREALRRATRHCPASPRALGAVTRLPLPRRARHRHTTHVAAAHAALSRAQAPALWAKEAQAAVRRAEALGGGAEEQVLVARVLGALADPEASVAAPQTCSVT